MKRAAWWSALAALALCWSALSGCASSAQVPLSSAPAQESAAALPFAGTPEASELRATTSAPSPTSVPWAKLRDGAWDPPTSGVGFGKSFQPNYSAYRIKVIGKPEMTTADGGKTIQFTSRLHVERIDNPRRELGERTDVASTLQVYWIAGPAYYDNHDIASWNEEYGHVFAIPCESADLAVGESTKCEISFVAPADEIADCYWKIEGEFVAAWPGQK